MENITPLEEVIQATEIMFQQFKQTVIDLEESYKVNLQSNLLGDKSLTKEYVSKYIGKYYKELSEEEERYTINDIIKHSDEEFIKREHAIFHVLISESTLINTVDMNINKILRTQGLNTKKKLKMIKKVLIPYPLSRMVLDRTARFLTKTL